MTLQPRQPQFAGGARIPVTVALAALLLVGGLGPLHHVNPVASPRAGTPALGMALHQLAGVAPGPLEWWNVTAAVSPGPSPRTFAAIADDPVDGSMILFGGANATGVLGDTWLYAGGHWSELYPSPAPSSRAFAALTYDPVDGYVLLFGGEGANGTALNDTWSFAGGTWTPVHPPLSPPPRAAAGIVFDASEGSVVLFGGLDGATYRADTWEYAHGIWFPITGPAPMARAFPQLGYDPIDGETILFGGVNVSAMPLNDTWVFHQHAWQSLPAGLAPAPRSAGAMAWDAADGFLVLYGGSNSSRALSDSWGFIGGSWGPITTSHAPGPLTHPAAAWDSSEGVLLLFGGESAPFGGSLRGTTWAFAPTLAVAAAADRTGLDAGQPTVFRAQIAGGVPPLTTRWSFSDGGSDQGVNVTHAFGAPGSYRATLNVTDLAGASGGGSIALTVSLSLVVGFSSAPDPAPVGVEVAFTSTVVGGLPPFTYLWSFGDGGQSTNATPRHAYAALGNFTVQLMLTDGHGANRTSTATVHVVPPTPTGGGGGWSPLGVGLVLVAAAAGAALAVLAYRQRRRRPPTPAPASDGPP